MVDAGDLVAALDVLVAAVAGESSVDDVLRRLAEAAARALDVEGAAVTAPRAEGGLRVVFATSSDAAELERLAESLESGPCLDSHGSGRVVDVADLARDGAWPRYQQRAVALGLPSVTTVPLRARGQGWGVLSLHRRHPQPLDAEQLAAARTLADLATSYLVVTADRDRARAAQDALAHRAMHDPLTDLPVRWVFLEQLDHALARLDRRPGCVGVLFFDLDGLKYVNDTYGHLAGDRLIRTCASRVRVALRPTDVLARIGGDEFVVLLEDLDGVDDAVAVADRVLADVSAPYLSDGRVLHPSASIGVAVTSDASATADTLIAHADSAMYRAKHAGRGRYEVFDLQHYLATRAETTLQARLSAGLRAGLDAGQLELHYQPVVQLGDAEPGSTWGVEALLRWRHPDCGLLTASDFVPAAEADGLIVELGAWVVAEACRQLAAWDARLGAAAPERVLVNVCTAELAEPDYPDRVGEALAAAGLSADRLTLEITERGLFGEPRPVSDALDALRALGCGVALDDFGTGHSSLSRLVHVPANVIKVDHSFTRGLRAGTDAAAVVTAVLLLGRDLRRTVVVEGVEDAQVLEVLRGLGCTHVQGFHVAPPQHPDALHP